MLVDVELYSSLEYLSAFEYWIFPKKFNCTYFIIHVVFSIRSVNFFYLVVVTCILSNRQTHLYSFVLLFYLAPVIAIVKKVYYLFLHFFFILLFLFFFCKYVRQYLHWWHYCCFMFWSCCYCWCMCMSVIQSVILFSLILLLPHYKNVYYC